MMIMMMKVYFFMSLAQVICKYMTLFYFAGMTSTYLYAFTLNSLKTHIRNPDHTSGNGMGMRALPGTQHQYVSYND